MLFQNLETLDKRYGLAINNRGYTLANPTLGGLCFNWMQQSWILAINNGYQLVQSLLAYTRAVLKNDKFPNIPGVPESLQEDGGSTLFEIWKSSQTITILPTDKQDCAQKAAVAQFMRLYAGEIAKFLDSQNIPVPLFIEGHIKGQKIGIFGPVYAGSHSENLLNEYNKCNAVINNAFECTNSDVNLWLVTNKEFRVEIADVLVGLNNSKYGKFENWPEISKVGLNQLNTADQLRKLQQELVTNSEKIDYLIFDQILLKESAQNLLIGSGMPIQSFIDEYGKKGGWNLNYDPNEDPKVKNLAVSDARIYEASMQALANIKDTVGGMFGLEWVGEIINSIGGEPEIPFEDPPKPKESNTGMLIGLGLIGASIFVLTRKTTKKRK